jgi:hypothetical protein
MDMRREAEAVEAREKGEEDEVEDEDEDSDDEDEDGDEEGDELDAEGGDEEAAGGDDDGDDDAGDDDDEDGPRKKKKKKVAKPKKVAAPKKKRTKAVKVVRQRATWVVFDNSSKRVGAFPFPQKAEAEALMAAKIEEKKTTFYIQLVKEPIEE